MYKRVLAIDFETANSSRDSVCSLGFALIEDNEIKVNEEILIDPEDYFDGFNIMIHGIEPEMVEGCPKFPEVWNEVSKLIDTETLVIAHNASFDMSVLRYVCDKYEITYPSFDYLCTWKLSKNTYEGLTSYSLDNIANHLNIEFEHHKASEDALVCLKIYQDILSKSTHDNLDDLLTSVNLQKGKLFDTGYNPCGVKKQGKGGHRIDIDEIKAITDNFDEDHPFFEKNIAFTGTLESMQRKVAMQKVVDVGGVLSNSLTKKTNYLVMGIQDMRQLNGKEKSSKLIKAETLISKGSNLEVIAEDDFLKLI